MDKKDPATGVELNPGPGGRDCPGNGMLPQIECCCDECAYYLLCFPNWQEYSYRITEQRGICAEVTENSRPPSTGTGHCLLPRQRTAQ